MTMVMMMMMMIVMMVVMMMMMVVVVVMVVMMMVVVVVVVVVVVIQAYTGTHPVPRTLLRTLSSLVPIPSPLYTLPGVLNQRHFVMCR